nr:hypothetical protein CFP56_58230 [Quercus suber]
MLKDYLPLPFGQSTDAGVRLQGFARVLCHSVAELTEELRSVQFASSSGDDMSSRQRYSDRIIGSERRTERQGRQGEKSCWLTKILRSSYYALGGLPLLSQQRKRYAAGPGVRREKRTFDAEFPRKVLSDFPPRASERKCAHDSTTTSRSEAEIQGKGGSITGLP